MRPTDERTGIRRGDRHEPMPPSFWWQQGRFADRFLRRRGLSPVLFPGASGVPESAPAMLLLPEAAAREQRYTYVFTSSASAGLLNGSLLTAIDPENGY